MTVLFDRITRLSLRFRWITILLSVVALILGVVALTQLNQELLPPIEFPAMVAVTFWQGASADQVLDQVTVPMENAVADVKGIVNVESRTGQGFSALSLRTEFGLDQTALKQEVVAALDAVALPEGVDPPELLSFSLGDIPVVVASASSSGLSLAELKEAVESSIVPQLETIPGVENVSVSGGQELPTEPPPTEPPTPTPTPEPTHTPTPPPTDTPTPSPEPTVTPTATAEPTEASTVEPPAVSTVEPWPTVEPVPLPQEWVQGAAAMGITLETTADITPEMMGMLVQFQPQSLEMVTWEIWRALAPEVLAAVPDSALAYADPKIAGEVTKLVAEARAYVVTPTPEPTEAPGTETPAAISIEPVPLPEEWAAQAAQMGQKLETTADLTPQIMELLIQFQPDALSQLTWEMWQALSPEVLAVVPDSALERVDPQIAGEVAELVAEARAAVAQKTAEPTPTADPDLLPQVWRMAGQQQGIALERAQDITVEILRGVVGLAPQLLDTLTPHHLKSLSPEALAWLPEDFIAALPDDLRAELETLAAPAGGLGAAAKQEAEEAAQLADEAPLLPESWRQPPAEGSPVEVSFETAADLLKNPFGVSAAELLNLLLEMGAMPNAPELLGDLTPQVILWLQAQDPEFLNGLNPGTLRLLSPEVLAALPEDFLATLDPELRQELAGIAAGTVTVFVPEATLNRTNGNPSLSLAFFKAGEANTVAVAHEIFDRLADLEAANGDIHFEVAFEQSSFIEESISGVAREGTLGAIFAVAVILLFLSGFVRGRYVLSWRSTLVTAVSIPLSVFIGFAVMRWAPALHPAVRSLSDALAGVPVLGTAAMLILRTVPAEMTLNIMTLSGMTVAVGRVVDDSIVVLENIYRRIQRGDDRRGAVIGGTRDVAMAIFASTVTTVIVFLPLGLIGGLVGEFFMPFGLTVTYALGASFVVAITVVPALAYLFIRREHMPQTQESWMQRAYTPLLKWALGHRFWTLVVATLLFAGSLWLLAQRPQAFIPSLGEPSINVTVDLPNGTTMVETDEKVAQLESYLSAREGIEVYETEIGSTAGMSMEAFFTSGVDQSAANLTISPVSKADLERLTPLIRAEAERVFGPDHVVVSAADIASTGFGGFSLVLTGDPAELAAVNDQVIATLDGIEGLTNVSSDLSSGEMIVRIDGERAVNYSAELETRDTMGVTAQSKSAVAALDLPPGIEITEGFETSEQTKGFADMARALVISIVAVYFVMALTFGSLVHPFTILFSLPLAVVGASLGLAITDRVLGISAMIGLMMLVGVVVTNAIVLLERVQQNRRQRGMNAYDALVEAGRTRLRPIWMTALAAILALVPLALGFTEGALIAAELATVVIGGLLTSTLLTLIIVPVAYSLSEEIIRRLRRRKET
jgi:multidrug efflux pump subunit AcrB